MSTLVLPAGTIGTFQQMDPLHQAIIGFLGNYPNEKTRAAYQYDLQVFVAWCEREHVLPLHAIRPQLLMYLRWLEQQGWKEATIARKFGCVAVFYKYAAIDDLIVKDPTLGIKRPQVDMAKQKRTFYNPIDFARFLDTAEQGDQRVWATMTVLGLRGLRIAEACSLDADAFYERQGRFYLRYLSKGGKLFNQPLSGRVVMALHHMKDDRTEGPLLLNLKGRRLDRSTATRWIKDVAGEAGLSTDVSPHSLRRSMITTGYAMGMPGHRLQETVGHANQSTTARYNGLAGNPNQDSTQEIDGFLSIMAA